MIWQSPPTTSGVVVISGSNDFVAGLSDFPCPVTLIVENFDTEIIGISMDGGINSNSPTFSHLEITQFVHLESVPTQFVSVADNYTITDTSVTTSGVVVIDMFPFASVSGGGPPPYIPPIFINQRVFPTFSGIAERLFPEENRRIYPVLPQFSVITPGD